MNILGVHHGIREFATSTVYVQYDSDSEPGMVCIAASLKGQAWSDLEANRRNLQEELSTRHQPVRRHHDFNWSSGSSSTCLGASASGDQTT